MDSASVTVVVEPAILLVRYRLEVTDANGNPISQVAVGQEFILNTYVDDLRVDGGGVFSGYLDVTYDPALATAGNTFTYGDAYPVVQKGDTSEPGLIDEAGALAANVETEGIDPVGSEEMLLWSLPVTANAEGTLNFAGDPADILPNNQTTLFGLNSAVPVGLIEFVDTSVVIGGFPGIVDDMFTVPVNSQTRMLDVLENDDPPLSNQPITLVDVSTPDNGGTAEIDGDMILYTPDTDFEGRETFTYTVRDINGVEVTATVTVDVVVGAPVAVDDFPPNVAEGSSNNLLDVLANDFDTDSMDPLTIVELGDPDMGGMVDIVNEMISYTPATGFFGTETFTYTIEDSDGFRDSATVTVIVEDVDPLVRYSLVVTDPNGVEITQAVVGQDFLLNVIVTDLREMPSNTGVFSAFLDVSYAEDLVSVAGPIVYGPDYEAGQAGDTSQPGLINEAGAADGAVPLGPDPRLLWSIPFTAEMVGTFDFVGDPADIIPPHETVLFGINETIPSIMQEFVSDSLTITTAGAVDDTFSVDLNSMDNVLDVLNNDVPPLGNEPFTLVDVDDSNLLGTAVIVGNFIQYTPMPGFTGVEEFTYTVEDATGATFMATVTVTVEPPAMNAAYEFVITDTNGTPIDMIDVGQDFQLQVATRDLRDVPEGVFAGYLDVLFSGSGAAVVSEPIEYGVLYPAGRSGTVLDGEIDELGAIDGIVPFDTGDPVLLATVTFTATAAGVLDFSGNAADLLPQHHTLVFGNSAPVDISTIVFGTESITINEGGGVTAFTNPYNPLDVDQDGIVAARDALVIINDLTANGARPIGSGGASQPRSVAMMLDVNSDFYVSAMDAIWVINQLRSSSQSSAQAASSSSVAFETTTEVGTIAVAGETPQTGDDQNPAAADGLLPAANSITVVADPVQRTAYLGPPATSVANLIDAAFGSSEDEDEYDWETTLTELALGRE
jgi:hypothetical protein